MRFVRTTSPDEYISAIALIRGADSDRPLAIPVCDPSGRIALDALAEALGLKISPFADAASQRLAGETRRSAINAVLDAHDRLSGDSIPDPKAGCIIARADEFLPAGIALAVATGRRLFVFTQWEEVFARLSGFAHATIVCEYSALESHVLAALARETPRHNIGVITARDFDAATFMVAKVVAYRDQSFGRSITIVRTPDLTDDSSSDRQMAFGSIDEAALNELRLTPVDFFGVSTHGDNIDSPLGPIGILCGLTAANGGETLQHAQTCETHGLCRRDPNEELTRLPFDRLRARFVTLAACSGIGGADSMFSVSLSQALAALDGWAEAFFSTIKIVRGTSVGPIFVRAALAAGLPYGKVAGLLSSAHMTVTGDAASYLLLGDAGARFVAKNHSIEIEVEWPEGAPGIEIALDATETCFLALRVLGAPQQTLAGEPIGLLLRGRDGAASHSAFATLARNEPDGTLLVFVFAGRSLPAIRLRLENVESAADAVERQIATTERHLTQLRWMQQKATDDAALSPAQHFRRRLDCLKPAIAKADEALQLLGATSVANCRMVACDQISEGEVVSAARAILRETDATLAATIPTWNVKHSIAALYETHVKCEDRERSAGSCYICGHALYEVDLIGCVRPDVTRTITYCQRCGITSDRPGSAARLFLTGPDSALAGQRITMRVSGENVGGSYIAAVVVVESLPWLDIRTDPELLRGIVGSAEGMEIAFDIDVGPGTLPGTYYINLCSLADLGLTVTSRPLQVERQR